MPRSTRYIEYMDAYESWREQYYAMIKAFANDALVVSDETGHVFYAGPIDISSDCYVFADQIYPWWQIENAAIVDGAVIVRIRPENCRP